MLPGIAVIIKAWKKSQIVKGVLVMTEMVSCVKEADMVFIIE